jgi:hypothetical protein
LLLDRSYHQGSIPCCNGDANQDHATTAIPAGIYMEFTGGNDGEWGIFDIKVVADADNVDEKGMVRAWTITGVAYCRPGVWSGYV